MDPTIKKLQENFIYDPETGKIFRRLGDDRYSEPGGEAFRSKYRDGYLCGHFEGKKYVAHRIAWAL